MAKFKSLPDDVLDNIAAKVGNRLLGLAPLNLGAGGHDVKLHETIDVWGLDADAVATATADLEQLAHPTGRWQHQIKIDGSATAYARTKPIGADPDAWVVTEVVHSEIAGKIDDAIDWLDKQSGISDEAVVRLLVVPAYHLHAFWILDAGKQSVVVVSAPEGRTGLQTKVVYTVEKFLDKLRDERHVEGFIF